MVQPSGSDRTQEPYAGLLPLTAFGVQVCHLLRVFILLSNGPVCNNTSCLGGAVFKPGRLPEAATCFLLCCFSNGMFGHTVD